MSCEGDRVAGIDNTQECYRLQGCYGCSRCEIKCEGCDNCSDWSTELSAPEPGDWVVVKQPILTLEYKGPKWTPAMDLAVGRLAWVKNGNATDGFSLKFTTTEKDILDQYIYPLSALRKALPNDVVVDAFIKTTKEGNSNDKM